MKLAKLAVAMAVITMMTVIAAPAVSAEDSVDLTATVLEPKPEIGIELNATALNFGSLYPGNTSADNLLKVTSIGLKTVDVTAEASDDQGQEPLFVPGLLIDSASWTEYESTLATDQSDDLLLALHVPDDYATRGDVSGGATFWAEEHMDASPVEDFTYTSDGSAVTITGYVGEGGDVIIPSKIDGLLVTSIGRLAFNSKTALVSVSIPSTITTIGEYAFQNCNKLTSVTIGSGVTSIGDYAFYKCTALTSVIIPNSVSNIGTGVFYKCSALTSATIGGGVTSIGDQTFMNCAALVSITFAGNAPTVGWGWADYVPSAMIVYYHQGATGFTNPWNGFTAVELSP